MAMNSYSFNSQGNPTATSQQTNGSGGVAYGGSDSINAASFAGQAVANGTASYAPPQQSLGIGSPQAPKSFQSDWASNPYWNSTKAGDVTAYGGGNLTRNQDGTTTYAGGQGSPYTFGQNTSTADIAKNASGIANQWTNDYGGKPWEQNLGMGAGSAQPGTSATGAQSSGSFGNNPWLQAQGQALQAQSNQNLKQNVLPGIGQGAQAAGMYGSSRQGTAEGIAMGNAQTGLNSALANMYSQAYGQDLNAELQRAQMANQMSVANMQNATQNKSLDNQFNLGMGQLDSNNAQFGANFGLQSQNYQNQWANNNVNAANQMAQTPWTQFSNGAGMANQIAGQGGSTSQTNQGNPWLGGLGGMQIGNAIWGKP